MRDYLATVGEVDNSQPAGIGPDYNLDVAGAQRLEEELGLAELGGERFVVDLKAVAFVASSGLRVILKWAQAFDAKGCKLVLTNANETVREVLKISGFDTLLSVFPSQAEGLKGL